MLITGGPGGFADTPQEIDQVLQHVRDTIKESEHMLAITKCVVIGVTIVLTFLIARITC